MLNMTDVEIWDFFCLRFLCFLPLFAYEIYIFFRKFSFILPFFTFFSTNNRLCMENSLFGMSLIVKYLMFNSSKDIGRKRDWLFFSKRECLWWHKIRNKIFPFSLSHSSSDCFHVESQSVVHMDVKTQC